VQHKILLRLGLAPKRHQVSPGTHQFCVALPFLCIFALKARNVSLK
jgi:hypothetical protein